MDQIQILTATVGLLSLMVAGTAIWLVTAYRAHGKAVADMTASLKAFEYNPTI